MSQQHEPRTIPSLFFDPDEHPEDTLKAFAEFVESFERRYNAQYPDPPKVSLDAAIQRWKYASTTDDLPDPKPNLNQYDAIRGEWISKDKVAKFLGIFSSNRLYTDWKAAESDENTRDNITWPDFVQLMKTYYRPTENTTLKHFHFRALSQSNSETFPAFCNRVEKEAKHCSFKCTAADCSAESTAVRDQILIGTINNDIREKALLKSWNLTDLRKQGMHIESAAKGGAAIAGDAINKIGAYSFSKLKGKGLPKKPQHTENTQQYKSITCYNCGYEFSTSIAKHKLQCPARGNKCKKCTKWGHFEKVCKSPESVRNIDSSNATAMGNHENEEETYSINIFRVKKSETSVKPKLASAITDSDFKVQVVINNSLDTVIADTGARVSVCGTKQAQKWNLLSKLEPSTTKIKPYNSAPIPVHGVARCAVTFGSTSIPVEWHVISGSCEPILAGSKSLQLGIIKFTPKPDTFQPILMIDKAVYDNDRAAIQEILSNFPENFSGLGKLKHHQVKLHTDPSVKPVSTPPRSVPYHLKERVDKAIKNMIDEDIIEEHPPNEPAPWVSCAAIAPKSDGDIRVTLDARNINKAICSTNLPIPRHEDIKTKLSGANIFSKMDFKSAFWQLDLHADSRSLTVFHANNKLYRYKRLTMGLKPAQGELNVALTPIFSNINYTHLIHDDLIIAAPTMEAHNKALRLVMQAISTSGLTLNPKKCSFGKQEIQFWGMLISADGIKPDPAKVEALEDLAPPTNKQDLISFLCMMQSNAEFISNFSKRSAKLRELTKGNARFKWRSEHQECFDDILAAFKEDVLLRYFDMGKRTFVFTDGHKTGLGAMLAQGDTLETAKPVAFASRSTRPAETRYPQLDVEGMALDFGLRRFRNYVVGAPDAITCVTDHKPLCPIFNGKRHGSFRTDRIKLRHQDVRFNVVYQPGKKCQTDYISRYAKPYETLPYHEQCETDDLNNLLYVLHTTPIIDHIGLAAIAEHTSADHVLKRLCTFIKEGRTWIHNSENEEITRFKPIMKEITITGNGILLKGERMILPSSLQQKSIILAHQGSHPGISGIQRRLRSHFFFFDMEKKVEDFVSGCRECQVFSNKKTSEPIQPHKVPNSSWEEVSVDLFGPMPSSRHIVVVQDLASRYPAAKIVTSTKASNVLPALGDIYNNLGNPEKQLSDNGPPFNSKAMDNFATKRNIELQKVPPLHPSANPVETFMRPLGKTMKIAHYNKTPEHEALENLLVNYRDTPHPATGVSPSAMLFRDGQSSQFPRRAATENEISNARTRDAELKSSRKEKVNASKYRKKSEFVVGDTVLLRNYDKSSKFDPTFIPEPFTVIKSEQQGRSILVENKSNGKLFKRHSDDLKPFDGEALSETVPPPNKLSEQEMLQLWKYMFDTCMGGHQKDVNEPSDDSYHMNTPNDGMNNNENLNPDQSVVECRSPPADRRISTRLRNLNSRYYNDDFINE